MTAMIEAAGLSKRYGSKAALAGVDLRIEAGEVVGLIGPNGAGKSTLLKALLGLIRCAGELRVLGRSPRRDRSRLLQQISYVADVAALPTWMRVGRLLRFVDGVHPRFDRAKAEAFLARTEVSKSARIGALSKGMKTQLHLALILGIDAELLILDEPTLGLDVLFRTEFYDTLLNDYFEPRRAILLTTHQVEEIEPYLTRVVFIQHGRITLDLPIKQIIERYQRLTVTDPQLGAALRLQPLYQRRRAEDHTLIFASKDLDQLRQLGEVDAPPLAELFVALAKSENGGG